MNCQDRLGTNIAISSTRYKETDKCCVLWYADVIILPRQARDKHRKNSKKACIAQLDGSVQQLGLFQLYHPRPRLRPHQQRQRLRRTVPSCPHKNPRRPRHVRKNIPFFTFFLFLKKTNDLSSEITTIIQFAKTGLEQTRKMVLNKEAPPARFARETAALRSSCCSFTTSLGHTS
jgi:hypothetical protein